MSRIQSEIIQHEKKQTTKKKPTHIRKDNKGEMKTFSSEGNL